MRLATSALWSLVALSACDGYQPSLPDGGRGRVHCTNTPSRYPVRIFRLGAPSEGATLTAVNATDGRLESALTDARGVASVTDALGPGVVRVTGALNDLKTPEGHFTFTCGECDCVATPRELLLTLE